MNQRKIGLSKSGALFIGTLLLTGVVPDQVRAQANTPGTGFDAALMQLFGDHKNFVADVELRVTDGQKSDKVVLPMRFAARDGQFRTEVDLTQMRGSQAQPDQMTMVKQMGMDRIVSITRTDAGLMHLVFPSARATVRLEMSAEDRKALSQPPKLERTPLGEEAIEGRPCQKEQVTITLANGRKTDVTVWSARDLKGFPVQIQTTERGDTVTFRYRNVRFTDPGADLFQPPNGYTTYPSMEAFTAGLMQKMMKEAAGR